MQLSYNVIKNSEVVSQGNKEIVTDLDAMKKNNKQGLNNDIYPNEDDENNIAASYAEAENIIQRAKTEYDQIILNANNYARDIEKKAEADGYVAGKSQGYAEGYERALADAAGEANLIINEANNVLFNAKHVYQEYLKVKKDDILMLAINMAERVLIKELSCPEGLNDLLQEALNNSKNADSYIIRAGKLYVDEIKVKVDLWRNLGLKGEIFIVADETVGECNAVIQKNNGRVEIGLKAGMDGIRHALL